MAGTHAEKVSGVDESKGQEGETMTTEQMLEMDLKLYGVCYEYMLEGTIYRLDPRHVKRTVIKPSGEFDHDILKKIDAAINKGKRC